ncbi:hypothetical protein U1T56_23745, partial [Geminicoccaceae bacterium SYSU G07066]
RLLGRSVITEQIPPQIPEKPGTRKLVISIKTLPFSLTNVNYHFISAQKRLFFAHSFGISLSPFPKECAKFFVNYFRMGHG